MGTVKSVCSAKFKRQLQSLPSEIQKRAREAYRLFLQDPFHPSFRRRIIKSIRHWKHPHWKFRITRAYRATCIIDDDTYVGRFLANPRCNCTRSVAEGYFVR